MALNQNNKKNKLKNKAENLSTKNFNEVKKVKTTSMRIDSEVKSNLENVQFDIQANDRIRLSLSDTVQWLINYYERNEKK